MKKLLLILILTFSFQTWIKADDIRDFEIEGISLGDSLLEFYSLQEIKEEVINATYYPKSKKMMVVGFNPKEVNLYERYEFHIKKNDKKYIIYSVKGLIDLSINDCLDKKKIIVSEIENQINNSKRSDYKGNYGVSFGNSLAHISDFDFKDGSTIRVWCSEWDHSNNEVKNYLYEDSLAVNLSSKEQINFVQNEGYE